MTLSDNKRTEIENLLSNIVFNVNMDIEIFGTSKRESKIIKSSELTDNEISIINSNVKWGMKKGTEFSKDRNEGVTITWETKK
jgi:hypothetical protein